MSAWITRTSAIFMEPHYPCCEDGRQARPGPSRCRDQSPPAARSQSPPTWSAVSKSEIATSLWALATPCEIQGKGSADALRSREALYVAEEVFTELFETLGGQPSQSHSRMRVGVLGPVLVPVAKVVIMPFREHLHVREIGLVQETLALAGIRQWSWSLEHCKS